MADVTLTRPDNVEVPPHLRGLLHQYAAQLAADACNPFVDKSYPRSDEEWESFHGRRDMLETYFGWVDMFAEGGDDVLPADVVLEVAAQAVRQQSYDLSTLVETGAENAAIAAHANRLVELEQLVQAARGEGEAI